MIRSRLHNEVFETPKALLDFYGEFFWSFEIEEYYRQPNRWRALKLISDQYLRFRSEAQDITEPDVLFGWLTANQAQALNVPLNLVYRERKPSRWDRIQIQDMSWDDDIGATFHYGHGDIEEGLKGRGWRGNLRIYIPYKTLSYDDNALRYGLAGLGVYVFNVTFESDQDGRYLSCQFIILERDFNFNMGSDLSIMNGRPLDLMDEEDEDGRDGDLEYRLYLIEEGLADDEDPRL